MKPPFDKGSVFDPPTPTIDGNTKVRLGVMLAVISPIVMACFFMAGLTWQVRGLRNDIQGLRNEFMQSWTVSEQFLFAERLHAGNPTLTVPDVRTIVETMNNANSKVPLSQP